MSALPPLPRFDGTGSFALWRKEVERLFPARQAHAELTGKGLSVAGAYLQIIIELTLSVQSPALDRVSELKEMKVATWKAKFTALTGEQAKAEQPWCKEFLDALSDIFLAQDVTAMRAQMANWSIVPRSQVYAELPAAVAYLSEPIVWDHLVSVLHPSIRTSLQSLDLAQLNTTGFITHMRTYDDKLSKIYRSSPQAVPIASTPEDYYKPKADIPVDTVQANTRAPYKPRRSEGRRHETKGFETPSSCSYCNGKRHTANACWLNPESESYRAEYVKRMIQSARTKNRNVRRSMFPLTDAEDSQDNEKQGDEYLGSLTIARHPLQPTAICAQVGEKSLSVLADTGATDSGIEATLIPSLKGQLITLRMPITFKYAQGQGKVTQAFKTKVDFGGGMVRTVTFMVFPALACSILLGERFLNEAKAVIDYDRRVVSIRGHAIPMLERSTPPNRSLALAAHDAKQWDPMVQDMISRSLITGAQATELGNLLSKYLSVFSEELKEAGAARVEPVRLGLKPDYVPKWTRYPYTSTEEEALLQKEVDKMIKKGQAEVLRPTSTSKGFNSRVRLVLKKNNTYRPTINLMRVNDETLKDTTPLPRIEKYSDDLASAALYLLRHVRLFLQSAASFRLPLNSIVLFLA